MVVHQALANLFYPPACLLCHARLSASNVSGHAQAAAEALFCRGCASGMTRNGPPVCTRCGVSLTGAYDAKAACAACQHRPLAFDLARSPWQYTGPIQQAIRQMKYHHRWRIGAWLAQGMIQTAGSAFSLGEIDAVLPVPMHWLKRRLKGFNPSADLARCVAQGLHKPYEPKALARARWTTTQTRLSWHRRFRNVEEAFVARSASTRSRTLLLVDDVHTSGATAHACAAALKRAGAHRVLLLTAARTPLL